MKTMPIKSVDIISAMRFDSSFHLSDSVIFERKIYRREHVPLSKVTEKIFTAGRSKRVYTDSEHGYPYLSNSDVISQNPFLGCKHNSKKYGNDEEAKLKTGMILTGRVGAIGQTSYVTRDFEEKEAMGSDNIIRIVTNKENKSGFIYAFLVSNIGKTLLQKFATGGVQPYITEAMVGSIPVPIFPPEKQEAIHNLIVQAAELRVEANKMLDDAIKQIEDNYFLAAREKIYTVNIKDVLVGDKFTKESRLEADFYQPQADKLISNLKKNSWAYLGDLSIGIKRSGLRERRFVNNGIPLITGQNLNLNKLSDLKMLSRKFTRNIDKNITQDRDILISTFGTIGKIEYSFSNPLCI